MSTDPLADRASTLSCRSGGSNFDSEVADISADTPSVQTSAPTATSRTQAGAYAWVTPLWIVVAAFALITVFRSHQVGIPLRDPAGSVFRNRLVLSLFYFLVFALVDSAVRVGRRGWSLPRFGAKLRQRWPKDRLILGLSGILAYHIVYVCYRNLKSWNAFRHQQDDHLLSFDKLLFAGHSPAVLLHDLLGEGAAAHILTVIYQSFGVFVPISFVAALVFANQIRQGYVFLSAALWAWILGVGSYYLIPSLGPFWSASKEFAGLDPTKVTRTQAKYLAERADLLAHPAAGDSFASIGAFASLHVGFTCLIVLMLRYYGFPRATRFMTVYLILIMISTIYLGWHFVADDAAGLLLAYVAVTLGRYTVYGRRGRPS
jgi:hypothetical protein